MGGETGRSDSVSGNDGNGIVGEYTTLVKIVKDKPFLNGLRGWNPGKSPRSCGPQIRHRSAADPPISSYAGQITAVPFGS